MIHAMTASEPEAIWVMKQNRVTSIGHLVWPNSTGNAPDNNPFAWQLIFAIDTQASTLTLRISPTILDCMTVTKEGHAKLRIFMSRSPLHINAFTQDEAITTHTLTGTEAKTEQKKKMLMRWWDTNGDPALIKTKLKINKFHLEVVVRRFSCVVQLIFIYCIIMTIIIISPHFAHSSNMAYVHVNLAIRQWIFGEWPIVGASFSWNETSNLC